MTHSAYTFEDLTNHLANEGLLDTIEAQMAHIQHCRRVNEAKQVLQEASLSQDVETAVAEILRELTRLQAL